MDIDALGGWLRAVEGFNDFELALGNYSDLEGLVAAGPLRAHLHPLGFHGSGSWIALWRRDDVMPWTDAAMVWIDSEGSPWEAFASTPTEGLAMLALYTGSLYDALSAAERAVLDPGTEDASRETWARRTPDALARTAARYGAQTAHRERLARAHIALPGNAFATALAAIRGHGRLSLWLRERTGEPAR